ncbi:MAG: glycosyltransferase [Desulfurivibrionaceae bacterium]
MKIVIDLQACQTASRFRGMGRYSLALAQAMARKPRGHELWLALSGALPEAIDHIRESFAGLIPKEHIVSFAVPGPVAGNILPPSHRVRVAELTREVFLADLKPDFIHVSSMFEGWVDDAVTSLGRLPFSIPSAVTFYDLIPLRHPETYLHDPAMRAWYQRKIASLRRADLLLAISAHAKSEAVAELGIQEDAVVNISAAAEPCFKRLALSPESERLIRARYQVAKPFVMYAGGFDARKNIDSLLTAFSRLDQQTIASHQLLIVGKSGADSQAHLTRLARQCGLAEDKVIFTGYVDDLDLVALYNLCALFVLPSLHEGFGLPALEAMACGAAVIGADRTSIPEVLGLREALFDPFQVPAITAKLSEALNDPDLRQRLREHGGRQAGEFSWERSAQSALAAMEAVFEKRQPLSGRSQNDLPAAKKRQPLAYVSPLPPAKTGIADYSAELLPALAEFYAITLIDEDPEAVLPELRKLYPVRSADWFADHAADFPRILYQFGNSPFHKRMFALLARHPGTVVLHDFFLSSVVHWMESAGHYGDFFSKALFAGHGYAALAEESTCTPQAAVLKYPCNYEVLTEAAGVIVHSGHARDLTACWYGQAALDEMRVIPQVREIPQALSREQARARLGLADDLFLLCSFGQLAPVKLNHRLIEAWLGSCLGADPKCRLLFVGQHADPDYSRIIERAMANQAAPGNIAITGFVTPELFRDYLAAADAAVQLRSGSRGETSRAVLDCLAHGLPLIINAHGAMAEWPEDILIKLADDFAPRALSEALDRLAADAFLRRTLSQKAVAHVRAQHDPKLVAAAFFAAIEDFAATSRRAHYRALLPALARELEADPESCPDLPATTAACLAHNRRDGMPRQLLVDVSNLVREDLRTGIERVTRAILLQLLCNPPQGFRIEPVFADNGQYRYAHRFSRQLLGISAPVPVDLPIDFRQGDLFLGLDLAIEKIIANERGLTRMQDLGVELFFVVYDLLPVSLPGCFPDFVGRIFPQWLSAVAHLSTGLLCISRSVADELAEWLGQHPIPGRQPPAVGFFHLGADLEKSQPSDGLPPEAGAVLRRIKALPTLLMVGTIEPRKGHRQALAACEQLWAEGLEVNLVMVGKMGWMMEDLAETLAAHPELNRRLFWLSGISDEYLARLYAASAALLAASEGEGFGLPLIEAARHHLPILARDLPVFREVAGEFATYFAGNSAAALALAIKNWLAGYQAGSYRKSDEMEWLKWEESAAQLVAALLAMKRTPPLGAFCSKAQTFK